MKESKSSFAIGDNEYASSFPTSVSLASTWNPELSYAMGVAIGTEARAAEVGLLLAPGVNIKRNPLCGRNFEYFSEDPLISGIFGSEFVKGVQSKGVGCCVKHFAANSNENYRFVGNSIVDQRALREIYLKAFEMVVKNAKPMSVMTAYNQINSIFCSENRWLLEEVLRKDWGFDGMVVTDWGGTHDRVLGIKAGNDLDMPGNVAYNKAYLIDAIKNNELTMEELDKAVYNVLKLVDRVGDLEPIKYDDKAHQEIALNIARQGAVLLKNENNILPLDKNDTYLVIGEMFEKLRFQGAGSSLINPRIVVSTKRAFDALGIQYHYEKGYRFFDTKPDELLEKQAYAFIEKYETVLFFGGLSDFEESEGFDRESLELGQNQIRILRELVRLKKKIVFVLHTGSSVTIDNEEFIDAILNMNLPGMMGGQATADILFGAVSPSGKLCETWLKDHNDACSYDDYNKGRIANYYESIYVGYRGYEKNNTRIAYPFGHGLTYLSTKVNDSSIAVTDVGISVTCTVLNDSDIAGYETVQVYVGLDNSLVFRPIKELKGFKKVWVDAHSSTEAIIDISFDDLRYYDTKLESWILESGNYTVYLGFSSEVIEVVKHIRVEGSKRQSPYIQACIDDYKTMPLNVPNSFSTMLKKPLVTPLPIHPFTLETQLKDLKQSFIGNIFYKSVVAVTSMDYKKALKMEESSERDAQLKNAHFVMRLMPSNSLRSMVMSSSGSLSYPIALGIVTMANGHFFKGLKLILTKDDKLVKRRGTCT